MLFDSGRLTGAQCYDMTNTSQQRRKESSWPAVVIFQPTASHVEKRHLFPSSIPMLMYVDARREARKELQVEWIISSVFDWLSAAMLARFLVL